MDIAATRQLVDAGKIVGIEVLDHVVLGTRTASRTRDWVSFRQENLM
jgi:DNA repair protein RadC